MPLGRVFALVVFVVSAFLARTVHASPPAYYFQPIHLAAREGNLQKLTDLLDEDPKCVNEGLIVFHWAMGTRIVENTPLLEASANGHLDAVKLLIERGAKVNVGYKDSPYAYPLTLASRGGYLKVVSYLIDKGADVNAFGSPVTPLSVAPKKGHQDLISLLLDRGAEFNIGIGNTISRFLLRVVMRFGADDEIWWLLDKGERHAAAEASMKTVCPLPPKKDQVAKPVAQATANTNVVPLDIYISPGAKDHFRKSFNMAPGVPIRPEASKTRP